MTLEIEEGKYYEGTDGQKYGPMLHEGVIGEHNHPWYQKGSGLIWLSDGTSSFEPNLVAEWKETEEMNTKCKAEELGYKKVRVTRDTCGWPVGFIGWLNPETNREVCNDDLTECWFHTLGDSCEYVGDTEDTPKISSEAAQNAVPWKDMTDEEKGALLLAHHKEETIEWSYGLPWQTAYDSTESEPVWDTYTYYRVKPAPKEPKRETVTIYGGNKNSSWGRQITEDTHKITFDLIDGVPDCDSIKMEELQE